ncbi:hypothetical protein ACNPQM_33960 [Streptomyces sp. NPDC056231]
MDKVLLRLESLLFPSLDVSVLSVEVTSEVVRVEAQCTSESGL